MGGGEAGAVAGEDLGEDWLAGWGERGGDGGGDEVEGGVLAPVLGEGGVAGVASVDVEAGESRGFWGRFVERGEALVSLSMRTFTVMRG